MSNLVHPTAVTALRSLTVGLIIAVVFTLAPFTTSLLSFGFVGIILLNSIVLGRLYSIKVLLIGYIIAFFFLIGVVWAAQSFVSYTARELLPWLWMYYIFYGWLLFLLSSFTAGLSGKNPREWMSPLETTLCLIWVLGGLAFIVFYAARTLSR